MHFKKIQDIPISEYIDVWIYNYAPSLLVFVKSLVLYRGFSCDVISMHIKPILQIIALSTDFLFAWPDIEKHKETSRNFLYSLYNTKSTSEWHKY